MIINCTVTTPEKITQSLKGASIVPVIFIFILFFVEILFYISTGLKKENSWEKFMRDDKRYSRKHKNYKEEKVYENVHMAILVCTVLICVLCIVLMAIPITGNYTYNSLGGASGALIAFAVISGLIFLISIMACICTALDQGTSFQNHIGVMISSLIIMIMGIWFSVTSKKRLNEHFQKIKDYLYNKNGSNILADWQLENLLEKSTPEEFENILYK